MNTDKPRWGLRYVEAVLLADGWHQSVWVSSATSDDELVPGFKIMKIDGEDVFTMLEETMLGNTDVITGPASSVLAVRQRLGAGAPRPACVDEEAF